MLAVETTTKRVLNSLMWSAAQNWGNRVLTFLLFLVLARLLTPADLGLASTVALILLLFGTLAEFGYGQAIVQRRTIERQDVLLPFAMSMTVSVALAVAMTLFASDIETFVQAPGLGNLLPYAAATLPLTTLSAFQEALYKRDFEYRMLALRMLAATVVAGLAGITAALAGFGPMSLVLQAFVLNLISAAWLWARPKWVPGLAFDLRSWRAMTGFSMHVVSSRLLEFATTRLVDFMILAIHGVAALGLYTIGSRVYQTLMQVLTSAISDVSLSALSRMVDDKPRLVSTYLKSVGLSACLCSPFFVAIAVLSPEISTVLFGARWAGSEDVMRLLMALGAVQTIQFVNGAYFSALGKPNYVLALNLVKIALLAPGMLLIPTASVEGMVVVFVACQILITPLTFLLIVRLLGVSPLRLMKACGGLALAIVAALIAIGARRVVDIEAYDATTRIAIVGAIYACAYLALLFCFARAQMRTVLALVSGLSANRLGSPTV